MIALQKLDMRHWTDGGTGVTNFDPSELPIYEAAVIAWGDDGLVLCSKGMPAAGTTKILDWLGSLHDLRGTRDLGGFWREFERAKASLENK